MMGRSGAGGDAERWIGSIVRLSAYASALMRRRSLPGRRERRLAGQSSYAMIGDALGAALISPMNEVTEPGLYGALLPMRGMSTMLGYDRIKDACDPGTFARLHPDAAEAMLPACLAAEETMRGLQTTIDTPGTRSMYLDRVSRGRAVIYDGTVTYAANLGTRDESASPDDGATVLSPAAMFAVHAARHLIAAPLLSPPDADDATILDMAAVGWIPEDDMIVTSEWSRKTLVKRTLAGMGGKAWPKPKHTGPEALTWMMGPDMAPAIRMERDCLRWHRMMTASPYDLAWAAPVFSGEFKDMDGHDMAVLWKDTALMLIRFAADSDRPVPPLDPASIRSLAGPAPYGPVWEWDSAPRPSEPDDDDDRDRAFRLTSASPGWPLTLPDAGTTAALLRDPGMTRGFGTARAAIARLLSAGDFDRGFIDPVALFTRHPQWRDVAPIDRLRADLLVEATNALVGKAADDGAAVSEKDVRWVATVMGTYPSGFMSDYLEGVAATREGRAEG